VVVDVIDIVDVVVFKSKNDSPISADINGVKAAVLPRQLVQSQTWQVHVPWFQDSIESRED